jgi:hypothetical protein
MSESVKDLCMTSYTPTHIGIPKNHADFESMSVVLFQQVLEDPGVKRLGRSGQKQFGIDLIGYRKQNLKKLIGIQCKKKKPNQILTATEVRTEIRRALKYKPAISEYIIVTTAENDRKLDQLTQQLTKAQLQRGRKIRIQVWGWDTLEELIDRFPEAKEAFDPGASPATKEVSSKLKQIIGAQGQQATAQQVAELNQKIDQRAPIDDDRLPAAFADKEVSAEILRINRRRGFPEAKTVEETAELATRVLTGNLARASAKVRADILERAARTHVRPETVEKAKFFHAEARKLDLQLNSAFFDALLPAAEGNPEEALRTLRKLDTPEAKGAIFGQLFRTQGGKKALEWIASYGITINDLDAGGALNLLLQRIENDEFKTALLEAETLNDAHLAAVPALRTVRSGLRISSLLPKDQRRVPFEGVPINPRMLEFASSEQTASILAAARADLEAAIAATDELRLGEVRPLLEEQILWLRLEDEATEEAARQQVLEEIKDPTKTLRRVRLALAYAVPFNKDALMRRLVAEKEVGEWTPDEQFAAFLLAWYSNDLSTLAGFFDRYGAELYAQNNLLRGSLLGIEVEALSRVGRFDDARKKLAEHRGTLVNDKDAAQMEALIAAIEEGNEAERLRKLFESSGELTHLRLLVAALMRENDHRQLAIYAPTLLAENKRVEDYEISLKASFADGQYAGVVTLAKQYPGLHKLKDDFLAFEGWSFFYLGKVLEARGIARRLVNRRNDPNDRELDINTAVESGDWGYLQAIVSREAPRASTLDAKLLVRLSRLAFEIGSPYVELFRDAAIAKAPDKPEVFLSAYTLAVDRGDEYQESRAHEWFQTAVTLSGPGGPIQHFKLKDILDRSSSWNKKVDDIDAMLASVKIPLYLAARGVNRQPVEFILGTALRNAKSTDPKQQFPVLAFSGLRAPFDLSGVRRVALDVSALFTLEFLGLLTRVINAFDQIIIAPTTLSSLFFDRQSIRFRQPSEVSKARQIKQLISSGRLKTIKDEKTPAEIATLDIDPDLQNLLDNARQSGAIVIRSAPVHKLRSLLEDVADLGSYSDVLTDTLAALDLIRAKVTTPVAANAATYLSQVDQGWTAKPKITSKSVVYLDQITVTYLHHVGILETFTDAVAGAYVSQDVENHYDAVLRSAELSEDLLAGVEHIRSILNSAIDRGGNVVFSSRRLSRRNEKEEDEQDEDFGGGFPSLDIMSNVSEIDVVICDDRFLNKETFWADGTRQVPCASTLDLILALNSRAVISEQQKYELFHRLREGGYHAVPIDLSELLAEIDRASVDNQKLVETRELAAIRLNLTVAIRSGMLSNLESNWTDYSRMVVHQAIRQVWSDHVAPNLLIPKADWLLAVMPSPIRLVIEPAVEAQWALAIQKTITQIGVMLALPVVSKGHQVEYGNWIEARLAQPTRAHAPWLLSQATKILAFYVQRLIEADSEIPAQVQRAFITRLVSNMHPNIEGELLDVEGFADTLGVKVTRIITFDGTHSMTATSFVDALRGAAGGRKAATISLAVGKKLKAKLAFELPGTATVGFENNKFVFGDVDLLTSIPASRKKALRRVFGSRPLTSEEESKWFQAAKRSRLTNEDYTGLVEALRSTPEHVAGMLAKPQPLSVEKLVPNNLAYYTRLIGPVPTPPSDISRSQREHDKWLVAKGFVGLRRLAYSTIAQGLIPFDDLDGVALSDIAKLLTSADPFSLMFGFELCRVRHTKGVQGARALGTKFLERLFGDKKWLTARCEVFSACALMATVALRPFANGTAAPLAWVRLAAFAHAGVLTDALRGLSKTDGFLKWSIEQIGGTYFWHTVVDAQEEPKWEPEWVFPENLKAELIGRCSHALASVPESKRPRAWTKIIEKALVELKPRLMAFFPGPLDGFTAKPAASIPEADRKKIKSLLTRRASFKNSPGLIFLAYSGVIAADLTSEIVRLLEASNDQLAKVKTAEPILVCGAYVASTTRNEELATAVIGRCARLVSSNSKPAEMLRLMLIALKACAAYTDIASYYREVGVVTTRFAYLTPLSGAFEMRKALEVLGQRDPHLIASTARAASILETVLLDP